MSYEESAGQPFAAQLIMVNRYGHTQIITGKLPRECDEDNCFYYIAVPCELATNSTDPLQQVTYREAVAFLEAMNTLGQWKTTDLIKLVVCILD